MGKKVILSMLGALSLIFGASATSRFTLNKFIVTQNTCFSIPKCDKYQSCVFQPYTKNVDECVCTTVTGKKDAFKVGTWFQCN